MLIDAASQTSRYEQFCRQLAGNDLADMPLYIILQSMLPESSGGNGCYGYTAWHLDLYLREFIPNYRGRGPCFVINDLAYQEEYADEDQDYVLAGCVMHELAHVLDRPMLVAARPNVAPQMIVMEAAETVRNFKISYAKLRSGQTTCGAKPRPRTSERRTRHLTRTSKVAKASLNATAKKQRSLIAKPSV